MATKQFTIYSETDGDDLDGYLTDDCDHAVPSLECEGVGRFTWAEVAAILASYCPETVRTIRVELAGTEGTAERDEPNGLLCVELYKRTEQVYQEDVNAIRDNLEVRRTTGKATTGMWLPSNHADVPEWVGDLAADQVWEDGVDNGTVKRGGSNWLYRIVG